MEGKSGQVSEGLLGNKKRGAVHLNAINPSAQMAPVASSLVYLKDQLVDERKSEMTTSHLTVGQLAASNQRPQQVEG